MQGVKFVEGLDGAKDAVGDLSELATIHGKPLNIYIDELPFVNLTPNKAQDVKTESYEQLSEQMETFRQKATEDKNRIAKLERDLKKAKANRRGPFEVLGGAIDTVIKSMIDYQSLFLRNCNKKMI